ncbi:unnamed protein product [Ascophyllum nodosum]
MSDDYGADDGGYGGGGSGGGGVAKWTASTPGNKEETQSLDFLLPESVKDFVFDLHDSMRRAKRVDEVQTLYNTTFKAVTDAYFKGTTWPEAEVIANQCDNDELFLCFYREMRNRHMFATTNAQLPEYLASWENYCRLFDAILDCHDTNFVIAEEWAFDLVHEFVYQFQSFCQMNQRRAESDELEDAWAVQNVIGYLHGLIKVSNIVPILEAKQRPLTNVAAPAAPSQLHQMVGYFAIIGMSRLQCLLGDYYECIKVLEPIDITDKNELFASNMLAFVTVHQHVGLAFLMLKRYKDAARILNEALVHVGRSSRGGQLQRSAYQDEVPKTADKMMALMTIATSLAPGAKIDDQMQAKMQDTHRDKLAKMATGDESAFRDLFSWASPKFVCSVGSREFCDMQTQLFMEEVRQQLLFPQIRSYLKLYTTIGLDKISRFNDMDEEQFSAQLVSMKHKLTQMDWTMSGDASLLEGKPALALDFNYFVEDNIVVIDEADAREQQGFEKYFMSQIAKCENVASQVKEVAM